MGKGIETRERIVDRAVRLASRDGLGGLTIGSLAAELGMSKSGLFAHFGSKEELQRAVLDDAMARFTAGVVRPALRARRGEPRLRALLQNWMAWANDPGFPGGCVLLAAAAELDDQPGPLRDRLVESQREWLGTLARAVRICVEKGQFRDEVEPEQVAFELLGVALAYHHARRLLRDEAAGDRARRGFDRILASARVQG